MPVRMLIAVLIVLFVCLLFAADRAVKVIKRARRRRDAGLRLATAAAQAEAEDQQRRRPHGQRSAHLGPADHP